MAHGCDVALKRQLAVWSRIIGFVREEEEGIDKKICLTEEVCAMKEQHHGLLE